MVTQLIDVLLLTPLCAVARFALLAGAGRSLRSAGSRCCWRCVWPPALVARPPVSRGACARASARAREANSALTSRIQETLAGIRVLKAYGAERARRSARFEARSRAAFDAAFARAQPARASSAMRDLLGGRRRRARRGAASAALATPRPGAPLFAAAPARRRSASPPGTSASSTSSRRASATARTQLRALFRTWGRVQDIAIGLDRVFELLDLEPEVQRRARRAATLDGARGAASRFRDVALRATAADRPALEGVSFEAPRRHDHGGRRPDGLGQEHADGAAAAALRSGRGRDRDRRRRPARASRSRACARRVAIALQENLLFGTTIRENIRYAVPDAPRRRRARGRARRLRRRVHREAAAGLRHAARRARHEALDRPAPAPLDRARGAEGRADPDARRADRVARRRDRAARAAEPRGVGPRPRDLPDHAPALDDPPGRSDRRTSPRAASSRAARHDELRRARGRRLPRASSDECETRRTGARRTAS